MKYTKGEKIAGVDGLELRDYFKRYGEGRVACATITHAFSVTTKHAQTIIAELLRLKMIERCEAGFDRAKQYKTTIKGNAWGMVKAIKPVFRAAADRILGEFMDRVRAVNARHELAFGVESVVVFGSYVSASEQLNDLDLCVELIGKSDCKLLGERRVKWATENGRTFRGLEDIYWPKVEVLLLLKNRARTINLCELMDMTEMPGICYSVLLGDKKRVAGLLRLGTLVDA